MRRRKGIVGGDVAGGVDGGEAETPWGRTQRARV